MNTCHISNINYLYAMIPSLYSVRKNFPPDTIIHACMVTDSKLDRRVIDFFKKCEIQYCTKSNKLNSKFDVLDIANNYLSDLMTNIEDDWFFIDSDCYSLSFVDWSLLPGDVIFGSLEPNTQKAPKHFIDFCSRVHEHINWDNKFYGSIMYVKKHVCQQYANTLKRISGITNEYKYYDDMYERLLSALISQCNISVAPHEYEYKVVFPWKRTELPKMIHMSFGLDWYRRDPIYNQFIDVIVDFTNKFPHLQYLFDNLKWRINV